MISFLRGRLAESLPNQVIVDVNGVGYHVLIPLSTYDKLPPEGGDVRLLTHYHVTERDHVLYGFLTTDERDLFRLLIDRVSGIGPKMGLAVLSGLPVAAFKDAVVREDVAALAKISGVGKKTAERIVLELKDKVGVATAWKEARSSGTEEHSAVKNDAVLALIALGYKQGEALKAIEQILKQPEVGSETKNVNNLVKIALRALN